MNQMVKTTTFFSNRKVINQTYLEKFGIGSRKSGIK